MKYVFFLGCVTPARTQAYEISARKVLPALGIELVDEPQFTCCSPPPMIPSVDYLTSLTLATRNLCVAEEGGHDIITLCNGCYESLNTAIHHLKNEETKEKVNTILSKIGYEYKNNVKVKHVSQVLFEDVGIEKLRATAKHPLPLRIGTYYGCHLLRPEEVLTFDYSEAPTKLDQIVASLGAESAWYDLKFECCGGPLRGLKDDTSIELARRKLESLKGAGVDCVAVSCPFCFVQLDRGQIAISDKYGEKYDLPIMTITELMGLAMGFDPNELGISFRAINADSVLKKAGLAVSV